MTDNNKGNFNNGNFNNQGSEPTVLLNDPMRMDNYEPNMNPPQQNFYGYGGMQPQPPAPNQNSKNNSVKLVLLTVIAVLLVVGIVIGALLLIQNNKDDKQNESQDTTASTSAYSDTQNTTEEQEPAPDEQYPPATAANERYYETASTKQNTYPSPVASWAETINGTVLPSSNINSVRTFGADQTIDGYANTCWCVNTSESGGVGGSFTVHLKEYSKVSGISIINGNTYMPSESLYKLNGQVCNFKLTFSNGTTMRYKASYNYASSQYETFRFSSPIITDRITFTVESSYPGNTYTTNVCLGEIKVF